MDDFEDKKLSGLKPNHHPIGLNIEDGVAGAQ